MTAELAAGMTWLSYRGNQRRTIRGPATGTDYPCEPRALVQVRHEDVRGLLRMVKARCGCGRMFRRRGPR